MALSEERLQRVSDLWTAIAFQQIMGKTEKQLSEETEIELQRLVDIDHLSESHKVILSGYSEDRLYSEASGVVDNVVAAVYGNSYLSDLRRPLIGQVVDRLKAATL